MLAGLFCARSGGGVVPGHRLTWRGGRPVGFFPLYICAAGLSRAAGDGGAGVLRRGLGIAASGGGGVLLISLVCVSGLPAD